MHRFIAALYQETEQQTWRPAVDIYRKGCAWLLKFDLAGVKPQDVRIRLGGNRITVSGLRRDYVKEEGYTYHSMEITYNRFERTIELPGDLSNAEYSLEAHDGLLYVKVEPTEPRT
jgi:HSP20 family protein